MSDMFESLELNMREEAERINPTKAIMASQLECEQRFESFVAKNPERVDFLSDDIRSIADKYAAEYDIPSETIYEATVTHLKEAAVKNSEWDKPWTEEDESEEEEVEEKEESEEEEKEEEDEEEEKKESSAKEAKECNCWDGYKRVPGTKPCAPGSCEKCDADREKKKAAFILENADDLVPDWIQKNAGWREMLRGFMNRNQFDPMDAPDWSSKKNPLPDRARKEQEALEAQEQPTVELSAQPKRTEYEDMIEDQSRAEEKMKENARKRQEMFESEPEYKTRGQHRYEYLRGASVKALEDFYVAQGMPARTASILVEAVGEMAQLQTNEPGLPVDASDPESVSIDKEIGGAEGDKYRNLDVAQKQKELGLEHQDFTDFGEPVREFIQPGGEAPYSENTKERIDEAEQDNLNAKGVKQEDNAPKKSSASVKEASDLSLVPPEGVRNAAKRGIKYHSEGKAGDGFESATLARAHKIAEGQELTPEHVKRMHSFFERHAGGRSQKAKQGEITPWDVAWLAWGGDAGRTWAASKVKQMENAKKSSTPLDFDTIDGEVEKLMSEGMTPEQAVQSLGVYNETNEPQGWGGSKN